MGNYLGIPGKIQFYLFPKTMSAILSAICHLDSLLTQLLESLIGFVGDEVLIQEQIKLTKAPFPLISLRYLRT